MDPAAIQFRQKAQFNSITIDVSANRITKGSLVKTSRGWLFISVALGKVVVDGVQVIALSSQSPLGKKRMGLQPTDIAEVNGLIYEVEEIV